MRLPHL